MEDYMNEMTPHGVLYENVKNMDSFHRKYKFKFSLQKLGKTLFEPVQIVNEKTTDQEHYAIHVQHILPFLDTIGTHGHLLPITDIYRSSNRYNYKHKMCGNSVIVHRKPRTSLVPVLTFMQSKSKGSIRYVKMIFLQIALGIKHIHIDSGLQAHGNLRPSNIYVSEDRNPEQTCRVQLSAYGCLENLFVRGKHDNLAYTSPELQIVRKYHDEFYCYGRSSSSNNNGPDLKYAEVLDQLATQEGDMWSLGMILYVLLNGQEPSISQANAFESLESKLVFLPNITPTHLSAMCKALLRADPFKRPTIDQILQECMFPLQIVLHQNGETHPRNMVKVLTTPNPSYSPIRPKSARIMRNNNHYGAHGFNDVDEFAVATPTSSSLRPQSANPSTYRHSTKRYGSPSPPRASSPRRRPHTAKSPHSRRKVKRHRQIVHTYGQSAKGSRFTKKLPRSPYRPPLTNPRIVQWWIFNSSQAREWASICKKAKVILENILAHKSIKRNKGKGVDELLTTWFQARHSIMSVVTPKGYVYR